MLPILPTETAACAKRTGTAAARNSGEVALAGSRRLRCTLAAAPVLFAHAIVTVAKNE
jgi:hypothetical protein